MPDIYSSARKVVVWLGPDSDTSAQAMKTIDNIGSRIEVDWGLQTMTAASPNDINPDSWEFIESMIPSEELWFSIRDLLERPWFERLWVWQEVGIAEHEVQVLCGFSAIDYQRFSNAIFWLDAYSPGNVLGLEEASCQAFLLAKNSHTELKTVDLSTIIYDTRQCKCSDLRDKVYGVLSLCNNEPDGFGIFPDYTKSVQEVFENAVLHYLKNQRSSRMLSLCSIQEGATTLPTWVNWSVPSMVERIKMGNADAGAEAQAHFAGDGVLVVNGVFAATVSQIKLECDTMRNELGNSGDMDLAKAFVRLMAEVVGSQNVDATQSKLESLCRTLCCGDFSENYIPLVESRPDFRKAVQYLMNCWNWSIDSSTPVPKRYHKFIGSAKMMAHGRSLIKTVDGNFGLVPKGTRAGDIVCVVLGGKIPLILRQDKASHYAIVGECYVDGIMTGEALLGQLPSNWKLVLKWFPQHRGSNYRAFLDCRTGETQPADPRLGPLPAGWRTKSKREDAKNWFVNDDTGEDSGKFDPRLRVDALKEKGITIQEFRLI